MAIDYYRMFRGRPEGPRTYDASNLPPAEYWGQGEPCGRGSPSWALSQRWLEAGQPVPHDEATPPGWSRELAVYWQEDPLNHAAVTTRLLSQQQYVAVVTLSLTCSYDVDY